MLGVCVRVQRGVRALRHLLGGHHAPRGSLTARHASSCSRCRVVHVCFVLCVLFCLLCPSSAHALTTCFLLALVPLCTCNPPNALSFAWARPCPFSPCVVLVVFGWSSSSSVPPALPPPCPRSSSGTFFRGFSRSPLLEHFSTVCSDVFFGAPLPALTTLRFGMSCLCSLYPCSVSTLLCSSLFCGHACSTTCMPHAPPRPTQVKALVRWGGGGHASGARARGALFLLSLVSTYRS